VIVQEKISVGGWFDNGNLIAGNSNNFEGCLDTNLEFVTDSIQQNCL